jgi:hypothetical protein
MSTEITPLQYDMFTGERIDTRTAKQKKADTERNDWQQLGMFKERDVVQFGVNANTITDKNLRQWLKEAPRPPLTLTHEDHRTEEEKETALRRLAESRTKKMFDFEPEEDNHNATPSPNTQVVETTPVVNTDQLLTQTDNPKLTAYLALIQVIHEQKITIWIDEAYRQRFLSQVPLAVLDAVATGLTESEIVEAIRIGNFLETLRKSASSDENSPSLNGTTEPITIPVMLTEKTKPTFSEAVRGYRRHTRQQRVHLRTRQHVA